MSDWNALYGYLIDDVRAALDGRCPRQATRGRGVALTVAAVPLWFVKSLISECGERAERALATPSRAQRPVDEMHLQAALAWSLMQMIRPGDLGGVVARSFAGGRSLRRRSSAQGTLGTWADKLNGGELQPALSLAKRFAAIAEFSSPPPTGSSATAW